MEIWDVKEKLLKDENSYIIFISINLNIYDVTYFFERTSTAFLVSSIGVKTYNGYDFKWELKVIIWASSHSSLYKQSRVGFYCNKIFYRWITILTSKQQTQPSFSSSEVYQINRRLQTNLKKKFSTFFYKRYVE